MLNNEIRDALIALGWTPPGADRDALRAEMDGVLQANRVLDSAAKDAQSWAYQLQECRAELDRTKGEMERAMALLHRSHYAIKECVYTRVGNSSLLAVLRAAIERKADA